MSGNLIPIELIHPILKEDFFFVQIGANDGVSHDPIYKYIEDFDWGGIMIEPQQEPYNKLKNKYSENKKITTLNCAISDREEDVKLYNFIGSGHSIDNFTGGGTILFRESSEFDKNNYSVVPSRTFGSIIDEFNILDIDLLVIDTEGYDGMILNEIDFSKVNIRAIHFEKWPVRQRVESIDGNEDYIDSAAAVEKLTALGYEVKELDNDCFATRIKD